MTSERRQLSLACGLSAGLNLVLFLGIAWSMAVNSGLTARHLRNLPSVTALPAPVETVTLVLAPDPEVPPPGASPDRKYINSPDDLPDTGPPEPDSRLISSRNMRAASEEESTPDGLAGLGTQRGEDRPFLDLRDSEFRDGEEKESPPAAPEPPPESADIPPPPAPPPPTKVADQPPATAEDSLLPLPEPLPDDPPAPPEPIARAAFRDDSSTAVIPLTEEPPPRPATSKPAAVRPPPPPLTRIPDRVPETIYRPGTRKTLQLGKTDNQGKSSVDAEATAEGRFGKAIRTAIEKNWRRRMLNLAGLANPGLVEVEFEVDAKGRISAVRLANPGEANPVMQDCALSAVIDAQLPPPPPEIFEELRDNLTGGRMRCSFSFLIY